MTAHEIDKQLRLIGHVARLDKNGVLHAVSADGMTYPRRGKRAECGAIASRINYTTATICEQCKRLLAEQTQPAVKPQPEAPSESVSENLEPAF